MPKRKPSDVLILDHKDLGLIHGALVGWDPDGEFNKSGIRRREVLANEFEIMLLSGFNNVELRQVDQRSKTTNAKNSTKNA